VLFKTNHDLDLSIINNLSRELQFLPFFVTAKGHELKPMKDTEAELYANFLKKKTNAVYNEIAKAIKNDESVSAVKSLLRSVHEEYYYKLGGLMRDMYYAQRVPKKRHLEDDEDTEQEDEDDQPKTKRPKTFPKTFKSCKNCEGPGHTRPTCPKVCNCGIAPDHPGFSCPSLKKNKKPENTI